MLRIPPWRVAPFWVPAAFDVNLCTDSVLPESIDPVRLRRAWVLWPPHSRIPWNLHRLGMEVGPLPRPCTAAQFFNSDRPDCLASRLCPPIEGFISCKRLGILPPKAPAFTAEDPFAPPDSGVPPGILQKIVFREPRLSSRRCADAAERFRGSGASRRFTRHLSSQTGASGHSSRCPEPGT